MESEATEGAEAACQIDAVLLWYKKWCGCSKCQHSDISAPSATGRHWCGCCNWRLIDSRQWCNGHQYTSSVYRKQRCFVVDWRPRKLAKISDGEYPILWTLCELHVSWTWHAMSTWFGFFVFMYFVFLFVSFYFRSLSHVYAFNGSCQIFLKNSIQNCTDTHYRMDSQHTKLQGE